MATVERRFDIFLEGAANRYRVLRVWCRCVEESNREQWVRVAPKSSSTLGIIKSIIRPHPKR